MSGALSVVQGETDAMAEGAWNLGLFKETMVGIFSADGSVLRVVFDGDQPVFELDNFQGSLGKSHLTVWHFECALETAIC